VRELVGVGAAPVSGDCLGADAAALQGRARRLAVNVIHRGGRYHDGFQRCALLILRLHWSESPAANSTSRSLDRSVARGGSLADSGRRVRGRMGWSPRLLAGEMGRAFAGSRLDVDPLRLAR